MKPTPKLPQYCALAIFDLDSTLAKSKSPVEEPVASLLCELIAHIPVGVISGAGVPQFQTQLLSRLPCSLDGMYVLPTSGAALYACSGTDIGKQIFEKTLTEDERARIIQTIESALAEGILELPEEQYGERIEDRTAQVTFSALGQTAPYEVKRTWDPDKSKRLQLQAYLQERLPDFRVAVGGSTSIDITREGVGKAHGVNALLNHLSIPADHAVFVGDALFKGGNDYPVISTDVHTVHIKNVEETASVIRDIINQSQSTNKT